MMRGLAIVLMLAFSAPAAAQLVKSPQYDLGWVEYRKAEKATGSERERLARRSLELFDQACSQNDPRGCSTIVTEGFLSQYYPNGERGRRRTEAARKAARLWNVDCATNVSSCSQLAGFVRSVRNIDTRYPAADRTDGLPQHLSKAADVLIILCAKQLPDVMMPCQGASDLLEAIDPKRAQGFQSTLCEADEVWACHRAGRLGTDEKRKLDDLSTQCTRKDGAACFKAGLYWYQELTSLPDYEKQARAFFEKGCEAKVADACAGAAQLHLSPKSGARDEAQARKFVELACNIERNDPKNPGRGYCEAAKKMASPPRT